MSFPSPIQPGTPSAGFSGQQQEKPPSSTLAVLRLGSQVAVTREVAKLAVEKVRKTVDDLKEDNQRLTRQVDAQAREIFHLRQGVQECQNGDAEEDSEGAQFSAPSTQNTSSSILSSCVPQGGATSTAIISLPEQNLPTPATILHSTLEEAKSTEFCFSSQDFNSLPESLRIDPRFMRVPFPKDNHSLYSAVVTGLFFSIREQMFYPQLRERVVSFLQSHCIGDPELFSLAQEAWRQHQAEQGVAPDSSIGSSSSPSPSDLIFLWQRIANAGDPPTVLERVALQRIFPAVSFVFVELSSVGKMLRVSCPASLSEHTLWLVIQEGFVELLIPWKTEEQLHQTLSQDPEHKEESRRLHAQIQCAGKISALKAQSKELGREIRALEAKKEDCKNERVKLSQSSVKSMDYEALAVPPGQEWLLQVMRMMHTGIDERIRGLQMNIVTIREDGIDSETRAIVRNVKTIESSIHYIGEAHRMICLADAAQQTERFQRAIQSEAARVTQMSLRMQHYNRWQREEQALVLKAAAELQRAEAHQERDVARKERDVAKEQHKTAESQSIALAKGFGIVNAQLRAEEENARVLREARNQAQIDGEKARETQRISLERIRNPSIGGRFSYVFDPDGMMRRIANEAHQEADALVRARESARKYEEEQAAAQSKIDRATGFTEAKLIQDAKAIAEAKVHPIRDPKESSPSMPLLEGDQIVSSQSRERSQT